MSIDTIRTGDSPQLKLFRSGTVKRLLDFSISANTYSSLLDIPILGIDPNNITVFLYGHYIDQTDPTINFVIQPNVSAAASIIESGGGRVVDAGYKLTSTTLSICVVNSFPATTMNPIAPFATANVSYFVFYY